MKLYSFKTPYKSRQREKLGKVNRRRRIKTLSRHCSKLNGNWMTKKMLFTLQSHDTKGKEIQHFCLSTKSK